MATLFSRAVAPATTPIEDFGTPSALAKRAMTAALASPLSGTALTRIRSTAEPSSQCSIPSMASRPALGVTRRKTVTPYGSIR